MQSAFPVAGDRPVRLRAAVPRPLFIGGFEPVRSLLLRLSLTLARGELVPGRPLQPLFVAAIRSDETLGRPAAIFAVHAGCTNSSFHTRPMTLPEAFPVRAPSEPPPPLPDSQHGFHELSDAADWPEGEVGSECVDSALEAGLKAVRPWLPRLRTSTAGVWSAATLLWASAPPRQIQMPDGGAAILDEAPLTVVAMRVPELSLPGSEAGEPALTRLRMVHRKLLPPSVRYPTSATWERVGELPAVLDLLARRPGGEPAGFSLSAESGADGGLVVIGYAPPNRRALRSVAIPLALLARPSAERLVWALPPSWSRVEEVQLTTEVTLARMRLEPVREGWGLTEWTEEVLGRGPFLRGLTMHDDRAVAVAGLNQARLQRFDWQPAGSGRVLTTVVTGIAGADGFSLVVDEPLHDPSVHVDPGQLLDRIEVT